MFGKKKPKTQSVTIPEQFAQIPPSRSIEDDLTDLPEDDIISEQPQPPVQAPIVERPQPKPAVRQVVRQSQPQPVVEEPAQPENFELITEAVALADGTFKYTVITNRRLAIGLQEN